MDHPHPEDKTAIFVIQLAYSTFVSKIRFGWLPLVGWSRGKKRGDTIFYGIFIGRLVKLLFSLSQWLIFETFGDDTFSRKSKGWNFYFRVIWRSKYFMFIQIKWLVVIKQCSRNHRIHYDSWYGHLFWVAQCCPFALFGCIPLFAWTRLNFIAG